MEIMWYWSIIENIGKPSGDYLYRVIDILELDDHRPDDSDRSQLSLF
ncbi:hypothetical protein GMD78_03580 [Ornithinibacillus sp. L9]|uniref:Uncharacterized protein n=1 Tax=Ornithinibacillus caprae TaxID=2678566 RepID=A0A6N8FD95_9BACI|nr:hypothetical protein [Ornithinibacillus caprae]MUK87480.1 hypothetical protein [Ornithinibacillus caprae]